MNVLIACEESQAVCKAFRERGHNAYSCDILECSGGHPEWHFKQDVLQVIPNHGGKLENGKEYYLPQGEKWDLMIAHPPCTYLSVSGARWLYHPDDAHLPIEQRREHPHHLGRRKMKEEAVEFFLEFTKTDIEHWAIENPVGYEPNIQKTGSNRTTLLVWRPSIKKDLSLASQLTLTKTNKNG